MAWISVHQQIRDHRKTRELYRKLNISRAEAVGILTLIWTWAVDNCDKDGKLLSTTKEDIIEAAYWDKDANILYDALVSTGWIDEYEGNIYLHDWYDFNKPFYDYLDRKEKDKNRKRAGKNTGQSAGNSAEIPPETPEEFHDSPSPAPSPSPSHILLYSINKENGEAHPVDNVDNSDKPTERENNRRYILLNGALTDVTDMNQEQIRKLTEDSIKKAVAG